MMTGARCCTISMNGPISHDDKRNKSPLWLIPIRTGHSHHGYVIILSLARSITLHYINCYFRVRVAFLRRCRWIIVIKSCIPSILSIVRRWRAPPWSAALHRFPQLLLLAPHLLRHLLQPLAPAPRPHVARLTSLKSFWNWEQLTNPLLLLLLHHQVAILRV